MDRDSQDKEKEMKHESDETFHAVMLLSFSHAFSFDAFCFYPDNLCPSLLIPFLAFLLIPSTLYCD
jgi:hypothetical protein